ncbi:alpha/beta hydrolase [Pedobacter sp. P351]|uniref:alpha/beta hydrolase n=1 Tax=Pedobacter superstes TaxID=3133441 RepID=UPI0030954731
MKLRKILMTTVAIAGLSFVGEGKTLDNSRITNHIVPEPKSTSSVTSVTFNNNGITMAGNLYLPANMDKTKTYPSIVVVHPGGGVKEQTAGLYAKHLSEAGFITLAFDASYQGASGGEPRFLDNPLNRVGDIYSAVDYLTTLSYIDANRIGAMGICAGSGATVKAAMTERRIKALATVSGVDVGAAGRRGWDGKANIDPIVTLEAVAKQRTAEANGAATMYVPYVPEVGDTTAPKDLQEAAVYYRTPRGQHPNSTNKLLFTGLAYGILFDGFGQADKLLTQPLLIIAGSEAGSLWQSEELNQKAASKDKELFIVKGATHMDLYDIPEYVAPAVSKLKQFYSKNL